MAIIKLTIEFKPGPMSVAQSRLRPSCGTVVQHRRACIVNSLVETFPIYNSITLTTLAVSGLSRTSTAFAAPQIRTPGRAAPAELAKATEQVLDIANFVNTASTSFMNPAGGPPAEVSTLRRDYRPEIDGLRAVAVLSVILFHAGFPVFSGGFAGVDIFFVISGYLITFIIVRDMEQGRFGLWDFYERRARRILPALFLVLVCCLPFAWMWMLPREFVRFSASLVSACLFISNIYFWQHTDYFAPFGALEPLLHTWSLAVEEHFYVLLPWAILLLWRSGKGTMLRSFGLVGLLSLALSAVIAPLYPSADFYLLPTRAWELMAGALCTFPVLKPGRLSANLLSHAGLAAISASVLAQDAAAYSPPLNVMLPVIGSCLIILFAREGTLVRATLSLRPVVGIGLISYSAYLWHQPLLVFGRIGSLAPLSPLMRIGLVFASLVLGYLSWRFVEIPFRRQGAFPFRTRNTVFASSGLAAAGLIALGTAGYLTGGFPSRFAELRLEANGYDVERYYREGTCFLRREQPFTDFDRSCVPTANSGSTVLWGDSHAAALSYGLRSHMPAIYQLTVSRCAPLEDLAYQDKPLCHGVNQFVMETVERTRPARLIIHADWRFYPEVVPRLERTIETIKQLSPGTDIIVVGGVPQWESALPTIALFRAVVPDRLRKLETPLIPEIRSIDGELRDVAGRQHVAFLSIVDGVCDGSACEVTAPSDDGWELFA